MNVDDQLKVKQACLRISLLMEHQEILPDLKDIALQLYSVESPEYLRGAADALVYLVHFLEQKGCNNRE